MPIAASVVMGQGVKVFHSELVNLYGCTIGDETQVGAFVEIQREVTIGARCKISSHTFICEGVTIEEEVSAADLTFRSWDIKQEADQLYTVTNPLNAKEHYSVFLGEPLGCTCGFKNCDHIQAVLRT